MQDGLPEGAIEVHEGSVHSADGTRIGYYRLGAGPPVVFVHGSVATHTDWMKVARLMAGRFRCYVMDRRGRGRSGAGAANYSLEREYEDICAVLGAAGEGAALAGHSFGAICAMGAALMRPVRRLVVFEPPLPVGGLIGGERLGPYARAIAEGDLDGAVEVGFRSFSRLTEEEIDAIRHSRAWPRLKQLAPTWVRELEEMDRLPADADRYREIGCPVLMLVGSESPEHPMQDASRALAAVLRDVRLEWLEGLDHAAARSAPERVAERIIEFLKA